MGYNELGFVMDKSCRLYVPFYKLNPVGNTCLDMSGNGNHGTIYGASRRPIPISDGVEIVKNSAFLGDPPTDWQVANSPEVWGRSGAYAYLEDTTPSGAYVYQDIQLQDGVKYLLRLNVEERYSSSRQYGFGILNGGGDILPWTSLWRSDFWSIINGKAGTSQIRIGNYTGEACKIMIGQVSIQRFVGYKSIGWAFDGSDDTIIFPSIASMGISDEMTILLWAESPCIKPENDNIGVSGYPLLALYPSGVSQWETWYISPGGSGVVSVRVTAPTFSMYNSKNRPLFRGLTYKSGVGGRAFYNNIVGPITSATGALTDTTIRLGNATNYSSSEHSVYEIAIFNRAFSAQEVLNYYNITRKRYGV